MEDKFLNDPLNIKDLIQHIASFMRESGQSFDLDTILGFMSRLLFDLESHYTEPDTKTEKIIHGIQKTLSGNPPSQRIADLALAICNGKLDALLQKNIAQIIDDVQTTSRAQVLWDSLLLKASPLYFGKHELQLLNNLVSARTAESYCEFLLLLVKHGFSSLDNIPELAAKRFYEEAQTYDYDQPARFRLLKVAADYGNKQAALEYGNYMNRTRPEGIVPPLDAAEAFRYTLMALPLPSAMWNLAYQLESLQLSSDQFNLLYYSIRINEKFKNSNVALHLHELGMVACMAVSEKKRQAYDFAYKIYFYLGYSGFAKGFNSMAKLLSSKRYEFELLDSAAFPDKSGMADYYYRKAVEGGCISAMQNVGIRKYKQLISTPQRDQFDVSYTEQLLQTASYYGLNRSTEVLGNFYLDCPSEPNYTEAKHYLEESVKLKNSGDAYYRLGLIASSWEDKADLYRRAMAAGKADAAYQYALAEHENYCIDDNRSRIRRAVNAIEQYSPRMSLEIQRQALAYADELRKLLDSVASI